MWNAIGLVSSGITLVAFIVAVVAWVFRHNNLKTERLIRSAPEHDRVELVSRALEVFSVNTSGLTKQQQYDLALQQIRERAQRFLISSVVVVVIAILASCVSIFALTRVPDKGISNGKFSVNTELSAQVRWELVTERSSLSYEKTGQDMRIFPNPKITWFPHLGDGDPEGDPQYHLKILNWLRKRADSTNRKKYLPFFIREDINLIEFSFEKPKVVLALMPTLAEYNDLKGGERDIVNRWLTRYVGQWNPRIRITVDNTRGTSNTQVISLIYRVDEITSFQNDLPFPKFQEYSFLLAYREGVQEFPLSPQDGEVSVPAGKASTFDVIFRAGEDAPVSPTWNGMVSLKTNKGVIEVGRLYLMTYNPFKGGVKGKQDVISNKP